MNLKRIALIFLLLGGVQSTWAATVALKQGYPDTYVVKRGDTLWDIAGHYLQKPWQWPTLWRSNPSIADPDLIYPGDVLHLSWINGEPRLLRGGEGAKRTLTLSPRVRNESKIAPIPPLPLAEIGPFLKQDYIFSHPMADDHLPYVLGNNSKQIGILSPKTLYVQGALEPGREYGVYRPGQAFHDPASGEWLGQEAVLTGILRADGLWSNGQTQATLLSNRLEVRQGDKLLPLPDQDQDQALFEPHASAPIRDGVVLYLPNKMSGGGKLDVVLINKGAREQMTPGSVLDIRRPGVEMVRSASGTSLYRDSASQFDRAFRSDPAGRLPDESVARVMLFRVYDRVSYGLILESREMIREGYPVGSI